MDPPIEGREQMAEHDASTGPTGPHATPSAGPAGPGPDGQVPAGYGPTSSGPPSPSGPSPYGPSPYGPSPYGSSPYGSSPHGPSPYGPPPYGQPAYGQPAYGQPAYGQPPYGAAPYGYVVPARPTNGLAIASMVLGILWLYWIGSVLALVFGLIALNQVKRRGEAGGGMAVAGIVLGGLGVGSVVVLLVLGLAFRV